MSCINRSHPEFKRLVALSGENPSLVAIHATIWMEDNNTTEFPTIDDLDFSTKKNDKFFSYSPIRKLGIRYNANQSGFMPSNVDWVGVTNEARKLGLSVNKSAVGTWFFKNQRGQFINPHKYQLDSTERRSPEKELNNKLLEWANTHGIKVEAIEEMIERLGPDSRFDGVVGVADLLNKIISIDPTKEKLDTLAEEVSHFATAILKDDVSFKRAMDNIEKTDIYKQVKIDYKDVYVREEDFKKEAVDKLLAQAIIDNFQSNDSTTGVIPYLKALYNKFWKWVNKVLKKSDVQKEIKDSLYPLAKSILNNEHLGELENINNIELPGTTFLQKEEESAEPEDSKKDKSEREIAIEFLNDSLLNLKKRLENLKRKKNKDEEIDRVQNEIAAVEKSIKEGTLRAGILGVVNTAERDIDRIIKVLDNHKKSEKYDTDTYQSIDDFINGYLKLFSDFKDNMAYYEFDAKLREEMSEAMQQLEYKFNRVTVDNDMLILKSAEKIGDEINTDFNGEKIDKNFNPRKILKSVGKDITSWRLLVGNWKQASSPILRAAWSLIEGSNLVVKRKAVEVATELLDAQTAMEKAGFKVNDLVEKTFDKDGNKTVVTQYLIREADWAGYISARNNHRSQMLTKYKYDNWQDFMDAYRQKEFTPKEMKVIGAELKNFNTAHPMKAVRDENGNITHYEPSAKNPEFKKLMSNVFVKNYYDTLLRTREESLSKLPSRYHNNYYKYMIPGIRSQFVEKLFRKDVSFANNISQVFQESVFRDQDDTNFGESNELGNKMIPIYFNTMFEDTRELSTDLTRSFTIYAEMAENFKQKNKIAGDIWALQNRIGKSKFKSSIRKQDVEGVGSNVYKALGVLMDRDIYGVQDLDYTYKIPDNKFTQKLNINDKDLSISKLVNRLTSYIRTNNLALNPFTSTAGYFKGTIDSIIEDSIGRYMTHNSKNWARKTYTQNITEVLLESTKRNPQNKMHLMTKRHNVSEINSLLRNTERSKLLSNIATSDNLYINYKVADYAIKSRVMLTIQDNYRLVGDRFIDNQKFKELRRAEGKTEKEINEEWKTYREKSYYNAFEVKNGQIVIKDEFKPYITDALENTITSSIQHVSNMVDGVMSESDKGQLSRQILGSFLLMHRGWFINMIDSRFMKRNTNFMTHKEDMGYYPAVFEFIKKDLFSEGIMNSFNALRGDRWAAIRDNDPAKAKGVQRAALDLLFLNIVALLAAMVNKLADDDDEDMTLQYAAYQMNRILLEQSSGNPLMNWGDIISIMEKPVVGVNTLKDLADFTEILNFNEVYESGMYKDKSHAYKWFIKRTPFKSLYEAQYPDMKNKFMKITLDSRYYNMIKDNKDDEETSVYDWFKALLNNDATISSEEAYRQAEGL